MATVAASNPLRSATATDNRQLMGAPHRKAGEVNLRATSMHRLAGTIRQYGSSLPDGARQTIEESGVTSGVSQTQARSADMAKAAAQFEEVNNSLTRMLNKLMNELSV